MSTILLNLNSNSLGDTIAFMPCANEFIKVYEEKVIVKIKPFFQSLFKESYPNITYYQEGDEYDKEVKVDYDFNKNIQQGFAEQMGFHNWSYIRPKIDKPKGEKPINKKYITAGVHSTAQLKYWNNPLGKKYQSIAPYWTDLFKKIKKSGIQPVVVEKDSSFGVPPHRNGLPGSCIKKTGLSLEDTITHIYHSEFFIGLSSGLSFIAHALGKPVVMISNFTEDWHEFDLSTEDYIRITNKSACHGCWNNPKHNKNFDFGDWYWCPEHKDTSRQYECHYTITPDYVYKQIEHWLK